MPSIAGARRHPDPIHVPGHPGLSLTLPDATIDAIVDATEQRVLARLTPPRKPSPPSPFMTVKEAAIYMRASEQRVRDLLSSRRLDFVKEGRRTLVTRASIDRHLAIGGAA